MASGHPVDSDGRVLPPCDWPHDRSAPENLEIIRRFCNTANLESGADRLRHAGDFEKWLVEQHHESFLPDRIELDRCVAARETLRSAAGAHQRGDSDLDCLADLRRRVGDVRFIVGVDSGDLRIVVDPDQSPCTRFIASVVLVVTVSTGDGTWERLKACRSCEWVVYDRSKNQAGQWCSMNACGGRSKVAAFRAREREAAR